MHSTEPAQLARFLDDAGSVAVLTGAGVSTASGIPGYRDRDGNWKHAPPVQYADFVRSEQVRQRYWARSFIGWRRMSGAEPNAAHRALAELESRGIVDTLITQNVDNLHRRSGSSNVIDLHGRLDAVRCLDCDAELERNRWQRRVASVNPAFDADVAVTRPDGDVELNGGYNGFSVPDCLACGGIVKPDVVFFGEAVPRERVRAAQQAVAGAGALLVVGSSLMVFSGFRFVRQAVEIGNPVAIVNQGRTRADDLASHKFELDCGDMLQQALDYLS